MKGNFVLTAFLVTACAVCADPVKVIFDTDMVEDYDDVGALALLHRLADKGEAEILATLSNTRDNCSVAAIEIINRYYGRPEIPVGCAKDIGVWGTPHDPDRGAHNKFVRLAKAYEGWYRYGNSNEAPDANTVYRKVLAAQPDQSVVICSVGFLTNLRRLLETKPDQYSPLDGKALVKQKVKLWCAMACSYPKGHEYNSRMDWHSSKVAIHGWPTPILFSDYQYGRDVYSGRKVAESDHQRSPVKDIFQWSLPSREAVLAGKCEEKDVQGRCSWDETTVLAAVRGPGKYFDVARGRYTMVGTSGADEWQDDPNGPHMRLIETMPKKEVGKVIDDLIAERPAALQPK